MRMIGWFGRKLVGRGLRWFGGMRSGGIGAAGGAIVWDLRLIVIRLDWEPVEGIVAGYLRKEKGWPRECYWIEDRGTRE